MTMVKKLRKHAQEHLEKIAYQIDPEYLQNQPYSQRASLTKKYSLEGYEKSLLVFENGKLRLDLSSLEALSKAVMMPFEQAYRSYKTLLDSFHETFMKAEKDPLFFVHLATFQEGAFLYIPPNCPYKAKLQVLYLSSDTITMPRLHIVLGANTSLDVAETRVHEGKDSLRTNMLTSFDLGASSILTHTHQSLSKHEEKAYTHLRVTVKKEASFSSTTLIAPHQTINQRLSLQEPNARCSIQGAWIAPKGAHPSSSIHIEHQAENTHSSELFKGIVDDHASSSFSGLITIAKYANKSTARQLNHNILLGKHSKAHSKPQLEILADDVQATHGSTTGQLDEQALLYMQSRGIAFDDAKQLLLQSFIREVTKELPLFQESL